MEQTVLRPFSLIFFIFLVSTGLLVAQSDANYQHRAAGQGALYQSTLEAPLNRTAWVTHPYWNDDSFSVGNLCYQGVIYHDVPMRYDVYHQQLIVQLPQTAHNFVPQQQQVQWFVNKDGTFKLLPDGFHARSLIGNQYIELFHRRTKVPNAGVTRDWVQLYDFDIHNDFFILRDGQLTKVSNLKSLIRLFPDQERQLRHFAKAERLKFNEKNREHSLYACVEQLVKLLHDAPVGSVDKQLDAAQLPTIRVADTSRLIPFSQVDTTLTTYYAYLDGAIHLERQDFADETFLPDGGVTTSLDPIIEQRNLDEVEITGFQQKVSGVTMGVEKFRPALLKNVPLALGEADVMKLMQTLPGVKTVGEASSGFNVRGGASDQNLILLNGSTIYNPMHLFGLFSAFNGDIIGETELYKSAISAQYGGRISSVMNIQNRVPDRQQWHGSASIGLLTAKGSLDAPLVKDRVSLLVSGRATYSDWMLGMLPQKSGYRDGKADFYDLNASLSITPNSRHRVNLYGYFSHDQFSFTSYDKYGYTNANAAIHWRGHYGDDDRLTTDFTAGIDHYDYLNQDREVASSAAQLTFSIQQYFVKASANLRLNDSHTLLFGVHELFYDVDPGKYEPIGEESFIAANQLDNEQALESAFFLEDQWQLTPQLTLSGGLRYSLFNAMQERQKHTYQAPEFRISSCLMLSENQSVKLGFNTMHQYIHKVSNTSIMSPTDTWTLSNSNIRPQSGWQLAAGYYMQTSGHQYEITLEAYFKRMNHYLTYRSAGQLVMNPDLAADVVPMQGRAYGVELQVRKPFGKLTGWVSYSYSRTQLRQHDGTSSLLAINGGDWYAAEYDRPHELKAVINYKLTHRYSFSTNADYSTGRPISVPAGQYYSHAEDRLLPYYTTRNGYRLPDYLRIDASFNIEPGHHLTALFRHWFSIGVYNLLGRRNAYSVYYVADKEHIQGYQLSIFGAPIPFVSYNIKF